jgi:hypothetical protein
VETRLPDLVFPNTVGKVEALANITGRVWRPLQRKAGLVDAAGAPLFNEDDHEKFASGELGLVA